MRIASTAPMRSATVNHASASVRAQRTGVSPSLLVRLALAVLVAIPVAAPPPVMGADLKDQIEAARERQANLASTIARQEVLIEALGREQASAEAALPKTGRTLDS